MTTRFATRPARSRRPRLRVEPLEGRDMPSAAPAYVPGELLVRFNDGVGPADVSAFYADHGLAEGRQIGSGPVRLVTTPAADVTGLAAVLRQDPRVKYAEPDFIMTTAQVPNDPAFTRDWGLVNTGQTGGTPDADIDADEAWDVTTGGGDVVVAVIDTGVAYTHPDLAANMWTNPGEVPDDGIDNDGNGFVDDVHGYDFVDEDSDPMDFDGHGTHVAGTIGMVGNNAEGATGVNWNVKIMAVRAGTAAFVAADDLLEAYDYVTRMRARGVNVRVTNNSYGGYNPFDPITLEMRDAIDAMGDAGILFVAAAGNESADIDQPVGGERFTPAGFDSPSIISVAATDGADRLSLVSDWGAANVDLAAPGVQVWSTFPGDTYGWGNGTSMASPHVAGAAALIWSAYPDLTVAEVKARILNSVDPIGDIGWNTTRPTVTNGRLNIRNALLVPGPDGDTVAPSPVYLSAAAASPWSVTLTWTATGDDGLSGRASFYDVRYSTEPITWYNWASARRAGGEPFPRAAGGAESMTVSGLEPGGVYYFAIKVSDNNHNESDLSNVALAVTTTAVDRFADDAEHGGSNWVRTGLWHRTDRRAYDSATSWYYGREATGTYATGAGTAGALTTVTPVDLSGVTGAQLSFTEFRQPSQAPTPEEARVELSRDGVSWDTAMIMAWPLHGSWARHTVDLTPYAGGPVYVRFVFDSMDADFPPDFLFNDFEGWYVDDVRVTVPAAPPAGFVVNDVRVIEGNNWTTAASFTVTRPDATGYASVQYATASGSARVNKGDFQPAAGTLTFFPGETSKRVTVQVTGDGVGEEDESFFLELSHPVGAGIARAEGRATILDDEPRAFLATPAILGEGASGESYQFDTKLFLTVPSPEPVTVRYTTANGTGLAGKDYGSATGTVTFAPGETVKAITLTVLGDDKVEPVEVFFARLDPVTGNVIGIRDGVFYILDDDVAAAGGAHARMSVTSGTAVGPGFPAIGPLPASDTHPARWLAETLSSAGRARGTSWWNVRPTVPIVSGRGSNPVIRPGGSSPRGLGPLALDLAALI